MNDRILSVRNLVTAFPMHGRMVPAVDDVSFEVRKGRFLGIVGESGSGKSVTALSIMRLIQSPGQIRNGEIEFLGRNLLGLDNAEMRRIRGKRISMIFQEPMSSLNPVFTVGDQIVEAIRLHEGVDRKIALDRAVEMFEQVGIPSPAQRLDSYPHEMSGGMRQRVMIAMALSCSPDVVIADEPTTALDVTIQAQIIDLLKHLRKEFGLTVILITHDLGVIAELVDEVAVMYAGKIVESGLTTSVFDHPAHPYTMGLLNSIPKLDQRVDRLAVIEGVVPNPLEMPPGCRFSPRCPYAVEACRTTPPQLADRGDGQWSACILDREALKKSGEGQPT